MKGRALIIGLFGGAFLGSAIGLVNVWAGVAAFAIILGVCSWINFEQELNSIAAEDKKSNVPPQEWFDKHYSKGKKNELLT